MRRRWLFLFLFLAAASWSHEDVTADSLWSWLAWPSAPLVVDVRENAAWQSGHIPQAIHMPWNSGILRSRWREIPRSGSVVLVGDERSERTAAAFLESLRDVGGAARIYCLAHGMAAWNHSVASSTPAVSGHKTHRNADLLGRIRKFLP